MHSCMFNMHRSIFESKFGFWSQPANLKQREIKELNLASIDTSDDSDECHNMNFFLEVLYCLHSATDSFQN